MRSPDRRRPPLPRVAMVRMVFPFFLVVVSAATGWGAAPCGPWGFVSSPTPPSGYSELTGAGALSATDAWAVGYTASGTETLTLHWGGTSWSIVPSPNPSTLSPQNLLFGTAAISPDDVWAVGAFNSSSGTSQTLAIHWNGSAWALVPSPDIVGGSDFGAVSALASNDVWAVGVRAAESTSPAVEDPLTAHWDGSGWTEFPAPFVGNRINRLRGVSARTPGDVWAVGTWKNTTSPFHVLIVHWDGSTWSLYSPPDPGINDQLLGVAALTADDAWAVGERYDPGAGSQPLIMHWDGTVWSTVSLPVFSGDFHRLNAIRAVSSTDIWAAGAVAAVSGGPSESFLMHWDGTAWSTVAAAPSGGGSEYFGGLAVAAGCDAWAVGSYVNGGTTVPLTERLQAEQAVGVPEDPRDGAGRGVFLSLAVAPNPAHGAARVSAVLSHPALLRSEVFDVAGRRVRRLEELQAPAGPLTVTWDGKNEDGARVTPGIYFIRLSAGGGERTARLVVRR